MNFLKTIFNLIEAAIFKLMQLCFGVNFKWLKYSKTIAGVLVGAIAFILIVLAFSWLFRGCDTSTPVFDEKKVQDDIKRQKEINDAEFNKSIERGDKVIVETDARVRQAEADTKRATANKSKGVSGEELDKLARDEK